VIDYLLTIKPELTKETYFRVTDLLNLEVGLLFFDYPANKVRDLALAA
jgi:hypothetical protein